MDTHVKFLVFADLHVDIMHDAVARVQVMLEAAKAHKVDFLLHLGDIMYPDADFLQAYAPESLSIRQKSAWFVCDRDDEKKAIRRMIEDSGLPIYGVLGNHDMDSCSKKTACAYFGMPGPYYFFDRGGIRFIVLDTNFIKDGDAYIDFDHCNYRHYKSRQTTWLPGEQLAFMEAAVSASPFPCVLLSHSSLGDTMLNVHNMSDVHTLLRRLNSPQRKVVLALNGHSHIDGVCVRAGVPMMDINSASNIWIGHKHDCVRYSETISRLYPHLTGCAPYWDALFAIIEMDEASIRVTGRESSYVGPSPYALGFGREESYHKSTPRIQSRVLSMAAMEDADDWPADAPSPAE